MSEWNHLVSVSVSVWADHFYIIKVRSVFPSGEKPPSPASETAKVGLPLSYLWYKILIIPLVFDIQT